jgi:hypothetical protein
MPEETNRVYLLLNVFCDISLYPVVTMLPVALVGVVLGMMAIKKR